MEISFHGLMVNGLAKAALADCIKINQFWLISQLKTSLFIPIYTHINMNKQLQ